LWVSHHPGIAGQPQITTEERLPHIGTICGKDRFTQPETLLDNTSPGQLSRTYSAGFISSRIIGIPLLTPHTQGVLGRSADLASTAVPFDIGHDEGLIDLTSLKMIRCSDRRNRRGVAGWRHATLAPWRWAGGMQR
jgi:hypothetical protein